MTISVTCQCGGRFAAQPHLAGKTVRCPKCQQPLRVPAPPPEPLAPLVNPFSDAAAPITAELVPHVPPAAPVYHSQDPFGGKASIGGPSVGPPHPQAAPNYGRPQAYGAQPQTYGQPGPAYSAQSYDRSHQKSYTMFYIAGAVLLGLLGFVCVVGIGIYQFVQELDGMALFDESPPLTVQNEDYAAARQQFKTVLTSRGEAPQEWDALETPSGAVDMPYQSGSHALRAFVDPPPADGQPRPGVVFLHGGFAWGDGDWEMAQPYRDQGFVVMMPVLRGENGQSGFFSLYYDEVDDVLAATSTFAALPYVDQTRLFLAGHSAGGTLATLTAMASDRFVAMASFSGSMNQQGVGDWDPGLLVFDQSNERETLMRSPEAFARSFKCPAQLYYGSEEAEWFGGETQRTSASARTAGLNVQAIVVPGDHFSSVQPAIHRSISFFRQTGLTKSVRPPPARVAMPRATAPQVSPPDIAVAASPDPSSPLQSPTSPDFPEPGAPDFSFPDIPRPPTPSLPSYSPPPRPTLPRGLISRQLGVVTFEVTNYSGRLPQRMSAHRALIRSPWADIAWIEVDEQAGVIRVPVRRGPKMNTETATAALREVGFEIGKTTFTPHDANDKTGNEQAPPE